MKRFAVWFQNPLWFMNALLDDPLAVSLSHNAFLCQFNFSLHFLRCFSINHMVLLLNFGHKKRNENRRHLQLPPLGHPGNEE